MWRYTSKLRQAVAIAHSGFDRPNCIASYTSNSGSFVQHAECVYLYYGWHVHRHHPQREATARFRSPRDHRSVGRAAHPTFLYLVEITSDTAFSVEKLQVSISIFGASLIVLYTSSTLYHSVKEPGLRARLRIIDHASIYVLMVGTYTPLSLITLGGTTGWVIFTAS